MAIFIKRTIEKNNKIRDIEKKIESHSDDIVNIKKQTDNITDTVSNILFKDV